MRRPVLLFTVIVAVTLLASSVALALTVKGTNKVDNILPYRGDDYVDAKGGGDTAHHSYGDDTIYGRGGNDTLRGGLGNDIIYGGPGADLID